MIRKLLIANRGEIAVRIARTAARMGITAVGVYSEADANALHVDSVDLAVALGGNSPAESYLRADAVLEAARSTDCDAIHPGYGFLAENATFAQAVIDAGLIWVGPTPEQIALLGDKVAAKRAAVEAGVATTDIIEAAPGRIPDDVPLPALVKAAAGGGGRGMRVVTEAAELEDAVASAAREAESAFGDPTVFIEPYLANGRHIEVQILGDTHGNVIHLGERECSIQRRNQKVLEESPSAGIDGAIRALLHDSALALARQVGYVNAGTVEFLVEGETVTFLEVNTRLQVEHPITEAVTGVDLVELQLRVAAGEALPLAQDEVTISGHAIEARVVAEDPAAGWLPSTGEIGLFSIARPKTTPPENSTRFESHSDSFSPEFSSGVRIDTGVRAGSVVSADYDSLLAKVIGYASTRDEAAASLARALRTSQITGVHTNLASLAALLDESDFLAARTTTRYLDDHPEVASATGADGDAWLALLLGVVVADDHRRRVTDPVTGFAPSGWRNLRTQGQRQTWLSGEVSTEVEFIVNGSTLDVAVGSFPTPDEEGALPEDTRHRPTVRVLAIDAPNTPILAIAGCAEERTPITRTGIGWSETDVSEIGALRSALVAIEIDGVRRAVDVIFDGDDVHTRSAEGALSWTLAPRFVEHSAEEAGSGPISPLPGTVLSLHVEVGDRVSDGDLLIVIEAMKMEHKITAHADATVTATPFAAGDRVDAGDLLIELEAADMVATGGTEDGST